MSFAEDVKNEIAHYETTDERVRRAELAALFGVAGVFFSRAPPIVRQDWNSALPIMP